MRIIVAIVIGLCTGIIIMGCPDEEKPDSVWQPNENLPQLKAEWEREYAAWKSLNIQNYQFIVQENFFGQRPPNDIIITVRNGTAQKVVRRHDGYPDSCATDTIDKYFNHISAAFLREENHDYSSGRLGPSFSISYDPQYHYPVDIESPIKIKVIGFRLPEEERWQPNEHMPQLMAEYEQNHAAWVSLNIQNYQYVYQKLWNPEHFLYWDYRARITVKDGTFYECAGLPPTEFYSNSELITHVFYEIYALYLREQIGWSFGSHIGMDFTIQYDPQYHYPVFFDWVEIHDGSTGFSSNYRLGLRLTEFTILED